MLHISALSFLTSKRAFRVVGPIFIVFGSNKLYWAYLVTHLNHTYTHTHKETQTHLKQTHTHTHTHRHTHTHTHTDTQSGQEKKRTWGRSGERTGEESEHSN